MRMIDDLGYRDWLGVVSWVHLVWNDETKKVFCDEALKMLGPAIATGQDGVAKIPGRTRHQRPHQTDISLHVSKGTDLLRDRQQGELQVTIELGSRSRREPWP
jgi:hypothetical protein